MELIIIAFRLRKIGSQVVLPENCKQAIPIISLIRDYGIELMKEFGIDTSQEGAE